MVAVAEQTTPLAVLKDEECWEAVLARDARFDGRFVYAVRSTGIYCRPSCPSRRPRLEQVAFFLVPEVAEQAGFRPCKRCHPHQYPSPDSRLELVRRACRYIQNSNDGVPNLAEIALEIGASPHRLHRAFKQFLGVTPRQYADACRLGTFKAILKNGHSISDALYDAGYGSSSRLYEQASYQLGMTPAAYRRGGLSVQIRYAVAECRLGVLLVAATDRGVCAVCLGDDRASLEEHLRREYPASSVQREDAVLKGWVEDVLAYLAGKPLSMEIPLDIRATAFQRLVWEELRRIPYRETRSYGEIARSIGRPDAVRAVGRACAANPVALLVPCHRAVRKDGNLGGYRWGIVRKESLLVGEKAGQRYST